MTPPSLLNSQLQPGALHTGTCSGNRGANPAESSLLRWRRCRSGWLLMGKPRLWHMPFLGGCRLLLLWGGNRGKDVGVHSEYTGSSWTPAQLIAILTFHGCIKSLTGAYLDRGCDMHTSLAWAVKNLTHQHLKGLRKIASSRVNPQDRFQL